MSKIYTSKWELLKGMSRMFLNIGGSKILYYKEVIGIFDLSLREGNINKQFLESSRGTQFLKAGDFQKNKSFVLADSGVYLSPIASSTLAGRESI